MRWFQVQQALKDGQELDRDWRAAHLEDRAASVTQGRFRAKWINFAIASPHTPCKRKLTLLKRDEKTS